MSKKILAKAERFGLLQQSKASNHWTAPNSSSANFYRINWLDAGSINANPDVQIENIPAIAQSGTHFEASRFFYDALSGLPTIAFSGTVDKKELAPFLVSALQACSEDGTTPFAKTITAGGLTSTIDWANNEGFLFTLAIDQKASADDGVILENAIINNLNLTWDLNGRGKTRLVQISGTWVGNELNYEQSFGGVWTNATVTQSFFNNTELWSVDYGGSPTLSIDSVDYSSECVRKVEIQINNNITSNCKTTGGKANQYDWAPEYKTMITLDYNSATEKILKDFTTGAVVAFYWSNDAAGVGTDGKWSFLPGTTAGRLMSPPKFYNGEFVGVQLEIRWHSVNAATPVSFNFTDTIDWGF